MNCKHHDEATRKISRKVSISPALGLKLSRPQTLRSPHCTFMQAVRRIFQTPKGAVASNYASAKLIRKFPVHTGDKKKGLPLQEKYQAEESRAKPTGWPGSANPSRQHSSSGQLRWVRLTHEACCGSSLPPTSQQDILTQALLHFCSPPASSTPKLARAFFQRHRSNVLMSHAFQRLDFHNSSRGSASLQCDVQAAKSARPEVFLPLPPLAPSNRR